MVVHVVRECVVEKHCGPSSGDGHVPSIDNNAALSPGRLQGGQGGEKVVAPVRVLESSAIGSLPSNAHEAVRWTQLVHSFAEGLGGVWHQAGHTSQGHELPPIPGRPVPCIPVVLRLRVIAHKWALLQESLQFPSTNRSYIPLQELCKPPEAWVAIGMVQGWVGRSWNVEVREHVLSKELLPVPEKHVFPRLLALQIVAEPPKAPVLGSRAPSRESLVNVGPELGGFESRLVQAPGVVQLVKVDTFRWLG
mmetsp:Transcript_6498/g.19057  ORF Transcript_6498/g.19057 Transcript_6498/m.19057 type:complete len:250 (+) Transcript_6498:587-1336(+)